MLGKLVTGVPLALADRMNPAREVCESGKTCAFLQPLLDSADTAASANL